MTARPRNAERTKMDILDAARRLFAERGIDKASLREIAAAAGVSHGLIQQYFGTREEMVAAIIKYEIDAVMATSLAADANPEGMPKMLREHMDPFHDFARIIMRAELAGLAPEKMLDPAMPTPATHLASVIASRQAKRPPADAPALDPKLVSAYVNAALFGFSTLAPWLMTSVGLKPQEFRRRHDEIVAITMALIDLACGVPSHNTQTGRGEAKPENHKPRPRRRSGLP
jgi:AcrR family transcriptional regulator